MHHLILWAGFLGAWALVAGPVYQAMLELRDEDIETARLRVLAVEVPPQQRTSRWWLLLPPVYVVLRHRRREKVRDAWLAAMTDEDFEALVQFSNKATAWLLVGFGGLMIALKETYELVEGNEWSTPAFWIISVGMLTLSLAFGISRLRWLDREMQRRHAVSGGGR